MQVSNKQIWANFSSERPPLSWAHPNSCDNACQPMIRWPFQLFVLYFLSQEVLSHVKMQPLGFRWDILGLYLWTVGSTASCSHCRDYSWYGKMTFVQFYLHWIWIFSVCTWLRWLPTKASVFLPHQRVYTWGLRDLYSLYNLRSPGLNWN